MTCFDTKDVRPDVIKALKVFAGLTNPLTVLLFSMRETYIFQQSLVKGRWKLCGVNVNSIHKLWPCPTKPTGF